MTIQTQSYSEEEMRFATCIKELFSYAEDIAKAGDFIQQFPNSWAIWQAAISPQAEQIRKLEAALAASNSDPWHNGFTLCRQQLAQANTTITTLQAKIDSADGQIKHERFLAETLEQALNEHEKYTGIVSKGHSFYWEEHSTSVPTGTYVCPLCGIDSPHTHTSTERFSYMNGVKHRNSPFTSERELALLAVIEQLVAEVVATRRGIGISYATGDDPIEKYKEIQHVAKT